MTSIPAPAPHFRTLGEMLANAAATAHGAVFVDASESEETLTYASLRVRAQRIAAGLRERGVLRGDRVAIVLPTAPAFVETFFGIVLAGAVPVPLYPPVRLGRLEEYHRRTAAMLDAVGAKLLVTNGLLRRLLGVAVASAQRPPSCVTADELPSRERHESALDPSDFALIQFSSGTTVDPKPVVLTHANVLANLAAIDSFVRSDEPNPACACWLPLYHDMGLIGCLLSAVHYPGKIVLIPPELFLARPAVWLRAISRHRATVSPAPNFAYGLCVKRLRDQDLAGVDLSSWRIAMNGAEAVTAPVLRRFIEKFSRFGFSPTALTPVYGLSEATLAVTFHRSGAFTTTSVDADHLARTGEVREGAREIVGVGKPLPGVEIELRDEAGSVLAEGRVGRVFVRSPSVMHGYFARPEASEKALKDGWLDTGDLGFLRAGELFLCGRAKDVIVLRGANHAPQDFEEAAEGLAGVRAGCVAAVGFQPPEGDAEELALFVETEGRVDADTLRETVRGRVVERTGIRPREVLLVAPGTLPRTSSGKLRRQEALRQWLAGELAPPKAVTRTRIAVELARGELHHLVARLRS